MVAHNILKQCAFVIKFALATTSHGYILGVHMNKHTLLNKTMPIPAHLIILRLQQVSIFREIV